VVALAAGDRFVWSWWAPVAGCGCLVELPSPFPSNSWWCCGRRWWLCGAVPPVSPPTWVGVTGGDHRLRVWVVVPLLGRLLGV
jgi:hypothetical protein